MLSFCTLSWARATVTRPTAMPPLKDGSLVESIPVGPLLFCGDHVTRPFLGSCPPTIWNQLSPRFGDFHNPAVSLPATWPMLPRPIKRFSSKSDSRSITRSVTDARAVLAGKVVLLSRNILVGFSTLIHVAPPSWERYTPGPN